MVTLPFKIGSGDTLGHLGVITRIGGWIFMGLLKLAFGECGVPLVGVLDVGGLGII
jgi:hypothetical protein